MHWKPPTIWMGLSMMPAHPHNAAIAAMADRVIYFADGNISHIETNDHRVDPSELVW